MFLVKLASLPAPLPGETPAGKQAATDPLAQFLPAPGCKDVITLTEMLLATKPDYGKVGGALTSFLTSEKVTRFNAARVMSTFDNDAFQDTYKKARAEVMQQSRTLEQAKKLLNFTSGLVEASLSKFQGTAVTAIFKLEAQLIIDALRPRAPFIRKVEQVVDKSTNPPVPSRLVTVTFDRSPNDHGNVESVLWKYYLIRGGSGNENPVAMKVFPPGVPLEFNDEVPGEGTYYYRIRALRTVGSAVIPSHQQSGIDEIYAFLSGIVPSAGSKTPAGSQMLSIDFVKTLTDPLADIYRGVHVQASDATPPAPINVVLRTVTRPPANLAVDANARVAYLSVPALNTILRVGAAGAETFAAHNFAAPGAAGLAIDSRGFLYTDNSASDARFGGRLFSFDRETGQRTHVGNTNYYSFLLQNAHPVSVQSLLVAPSPRGEALYIADATSQRITLLTLPWRWAPGVTAPRNISQPYIASPLFNFGGSTTMAMRADDTLAITQYDNVLMVAPGGRRVDPIFRDGESSFTDLTGVTFDRYLNMYVTDATAGTITMIPLMNQSPYFGFFGMDDVQKRRLTVLRGARRPSDVKLRVGGDGLAFFDGERALVQVAFGMSGRLTRADGSALAGATVLLPEVNRVAVSDGDGVFVLSNLLDRDQSPIFDVVVRADGKTQSYVAPLDPFKHNLVDFVFDPPSAVPPPPPGDNPPPPPPPPGDRTRVTVQPPDITTPETVSTRVDVQRTGDPPADPDDEDDACARAVFVRPGMGAGLATATPLVAGWFTTPGIPDPVLVVNGVPQPIATTTQDFALAPTLLVGQNTLYVAVRGEWLKSEGCAAPDVDDEALVSISTTLTVFHDVDPAALAQYRAGANFDLSIRGVIRDNGRPLAGIAVEVPGTSHLSWTDVDGVFQIDLSRTAMAARAAGVDALSSAMYARAGAIVALIGNDQRAASIAALEALLAQAAAVSTAPPAAGSAAGTVVDLAVQVEAVASRLLLALQSTEGIAEQADVDALGALGQQLAGATSNGEIVVRGREYPTLTLKVKVQ
ncbi:hypothetical protein TBR22_A40600 [Luteitalea sp. TBR-22]|nr:hypothetical protein TBR22_A40600 [Luteitalea sp. TBR-22]